MKRVLSLLILFTGCVCSPDLDFERRPDTNDPWNTNYLLALDPTVVTNAELESHAISIEKRFWRYSQSHGIVWPAWRSDGSLEYPDRWINGGDSGIFTGIALAGLSFKYRVTREPEDLEGLVKLLLGVYTLTHATGKPGVICRNAAPTTEAHKFGYPLEFADKIEAGFANLGPLLPDPINGGLIGGALPQNFWYYTRGTKDQLTGIILGLAAAWKVLEPADIPDASKHRAERARIVIAETTEDIYNHLIEHKWYIRNEAGKNDSSADYVDDLIRVVVLSLYKETSSLTNPIRQSIINEDYKKEFEDFIDLANTLAYADQFNNFDSYYGHNLRICRAFTIWLLETDPSRRDQIRDYVDSNIWIYVKDHRNAWFNFVRNTMWPAEGQENREDGLRGLKGLARRPTRMWSSPLFGQGKKPSIIAVTLNCTGGYVVDTHLRKPEDYWIWQKEPWDVGEAFPVTGWDVHGWGERSGIDFFTAYWLGVSSEIIR
ncbi:MAG: hypothetical protein MN733_02945 [Nitrososphaera sp.]|nr:hypothetical protein [Nitrososphaera sp.]